MHGHELLHVFAAAALLAVGAFLVPAGWLARRRALAARSATGGREPARGTPRPAVSGDRFIGVVAAILSLGAAIIHAAVVPEHLAEFPPFGIAFAILAGIQTVSAIALVARWGGATRATIVLNVGVIVFWLASRTVGLPIGPGPWVAEPIGLIDVVATGFELALVVLLTLPQRGWWSGRAGARRLDRASIALVPTAGVIGLATLIALASLSGPGDAHHGSDAAAIHAHAGDVTR